MSLNEFSLIEKFFNKQASRDDVIVGIGDDCALLQSPHAQSLAVTTDTLVSGIHFSPNVNPAKLGRKCLAVNLSDLAAMGAKPAWVTLSLTIPSVDELWLDQFCGGFFELAKRYDIQLVGGDLTHGPLSVTVQATGFVPELEALRRNAAKEGDSIFVSGCLGDAGAALILLKEDKSVPCKLLHRLECPEARVDLGIALRNIAHAAIDISDGLMADLQHILDASQLGATIYVDQIPLSNELKCAFSNNAAIDFALTAGDDYELCFTVSNENKKKYSALLEEYGCICLGQIEESPGLNLICSDGSEYLTRSMGYLHF